VPRDQGGKKTLARGNEEPSETRKGGAFPNPSLKGSKFQGGRTPSKKRKKKIVFGQTRMGGKKKKERKPTI